MKVKALIEMLQETDPELNVELTKIISVTKPKDESGNSIPYLVSLDFPIIGLAKKNDDLYLVTEAAPEMIAFGKDIKRLDGKPLGEEDLKAIGMKE